MQEKIHQINNEGHQKWCSAMFSANVVFAGIIFFMELVMCFVFAAQGLHEEPIREYVISAMLVPTALDLAILLAGFFLMRARWMKSEWMNYIPLMQMVCLCFVLTTVHSLFSIVSASFCFPIFISVIFHERKMTRSISLLSLLCLTLAQILGSWLYPVENAYRFAEYLIAVAILCSSNVLCELMLQYEQQQSRKLEMLYRSRTEIMEQLKYDQKTGLHGHTSFQTGLKKLVEEAAMNGIPAVAVLDIDDFKKVNDTYGHIKGDTVILEVARTMREVCGDKYIAARFGGEEFSILFRNGTVEDYVKTVETIRQNMERMSFDFLEKPVTLSAGIAIWKPGWGAAEFFDRADQALYVSKRQGRNRTTVYENDHTNPASMYL